MVYSAQFRQLSIRISALRKRFLPAQFSPTGAYSTYQFDRARAYRLLTHAEIEYYFEQRAIEIAHGAIVRWQTKGRSSYALMHIVCNITGEKGGLPRRLGSNVTSTSIIKKALDQYYHVVRENHGIRTPNILQLLLPLGIQEVDLDPSWLSTIDAFGAKRGVAAHSAAVSYLIDPKDDFNTVQLVIAGIKDVDILLNKIRRELR